jgi:hypothetical protein
MSVRALRILAAAAVTAVLTVFGAWAPVPAAPPDAQAVPAPPSRDEIPRRLAGEQFSSDGAVSLGPDRFPYVSAFRAGSETANTDAKRYAMPELAQLALSRHAGIAVYERSKTERPLWVFSLGAVAALAKGEWQPYDRTTSIAVGAGESLVTGTPSLDALPAELRRAIAEYMRTTDGVATPKVALIGVKDAASSYERRTFMAPNLPRSAFPSDELWAEALHRIEWFIPPQFIAVRPPPAPDRFDAWFRVVQPVSP